MDMTTQTINDLRKLESDIKDIRKLAGNTYTTTTGLVAYDLQAPAKNLYPVLTPIRNIIPRVGGGVGTATNWRQITAITGSGYDAMGWVSEGQRAAAMSVTEADKAASYRTLGEEEAVTFEAVNAARTFEDILATGVLRVLQKTMIKEENAILGGNNSNTIAAPSTPVTSAATSGGSIATGSYIVTAVALTYEGYMNYLAAPASGVPVSRTVTGQDGGTFVLNGGSSNKSTSSSAQSVTGPNGVLKATVLPQFGAVAFAWYVDDGAGGASTFQTATTNSSVVFTALTTSGQNLTAITGDHSKNSLAFDGILYSAVANNTLAYNVAMATPTGTAIGTGNGLTPNGYGGIVEIDTMLKTMWDNYRLSPDVIWVNSQERKNITAKTFQSSTGATLAQFRMDQVNGKAIIAGSMVNAYYNPFTAVEEGEAIPVRLHPTLPAGTLIAWAKNLPAQYQNSNVPNVAEMKIRAEYHQIEWPLVTRSRQVGVYVEEVLAVYAPFALGCIYNIGNA